MIRFLLSMTLLTLVYTLTLASVKLWDVVFGVVVSAILLIGSRQFLFGGWPAPLPGLPRRMVAFFPFVGAVFRDAVVGTWTVTRVIFNLRPPDRFGIVAVPIEDRTVSGVAVTTLATTLSPGSILIDVDWAEGVMLFYYLDARDPEAIRAKHREFYERYQRRVFP